MRRFLFLPILLILIFSLGCVQKQQEKEEEKGIEAKIMINGQSGKVTLYQDSSPVVFVKVTNNMDHDLINPRIYWLGCGNLTPLSNLTRIKSGGEGTLSYQLDLSEINVPPGASTSCYLEGRLCFDRSDAAYTEISIYNQTPKSSLNQNYDSSFLSITFYDQYVRSGSSSTIRLRIENVQNGYLYYPEDFESGVITSLKITPGEHLSIKEIGGETIESPKGSVTITADENKYLLRLINGKYLELPIKVSADDIGDSLTTMNVEVNYTYCVPIGKIYLIVKG